MTYSSCLHDQQDLCWRNTSRDTSEESQESQLTIATWLPIGSLHQQNTSAIIVTVASWILEDFMKM